jgi:hypothetical protein
VLLAALVLAAGCGGGAPSVTTADQTAIAGHAAGLARAQQALGVLDLLLQGGAVLDPTVSEFANADAVAQNAGIAVACAVVTEPTGAGAVVMVAFPPDCTARGVAVGGALSLEIQRSTTSAQSLSVVVTPQSFTVAGFGPFSGTTTLGVVGGASGFAVTLDLEETSFKTTGTLTLTEVEGSVMLDGTLRAQGGVMPGGISGTLAGVTLAPGTCYPFSGADLVGDVVVTFVPTTPQDGLAQATKGAASSDAGLDLTAGTTVSLALPGYGSCPP